MADPYRDEYAEQAYRLCLLGHTDKELAKAFATDEGSIVAWRLKQPEFAEACRRGKTHADAEVAASLFQRAVGYSHPETKVFSYQGDIVTHEVTKHHPPDTAAIKFWLINRTRKSDEPWSDTVEHKGSAEAPLFIIENVKPPTTETDA